MSRNKNIKKSAVAVLIMMDPRPRTKKKRLNIERTV